MTRIAIVVEGQTEETFITDVLAPVMPFGVWLTASPLGLPGHKGGNVKYSRVKPTVLRFLRQPQFDYCTTMFDLYGLGTDFPQITGAERRGRLLAEALETATVDDIMQAAPNLRAAKRFRPYFQVYEFEGLLFSDPESLARSLGRPVSGLQSIRNQFQTPEDINDGPSTAPSKRILAEYAAYSKVTDGITAAKRIGVERMRQECPRFDQWVSFLESTAAPSSR